MCVFCLCVDAKLGVFHYRSDKGQYKLNYTAAQQSCTAEGGSLATYTQLSYAQKVSKHNMDLCLSETCLCEWFYEGRPLVFFMVSFLYCNKFCVDIKAVIKLLKTHQGVTLLHWLTH